MTQADLFDVEPAAPQRKPKTVTAPTWTANTTKTICYDCVTRLADGEWITPARARWRRTDSEGVRLYCYTCAVAYRDADHTAAQRAA